MSENILNALTQLFGIITKQDGGATHVERNFVVKYFNEQLDQDSVKAYTKIYDEVSDFGNGGPKRMPVKEAVRILRYCRDINKDLAQGQKLIILVKLLELIASDGNFSDTRREIIDTVSNAFNFDKEDYKVIESFVLEKDASLLNFKDILTISGKGMLTDETETKYQKVEGLQGEIIFLWAKTAELFFVKTTSSDKITFNGLPMNPHQIYLFSNGSSVKTDKGAVFYYSDIADIFLNTERKVRLSFTAKDIVFKFPNGAIGLRDIDISEPQGKLVGIMGGSGAGKTTLLNVLAGIETPSNGEVLINGVDIHKEKDEIKGVIGYIAQDDLLIEELTVYQNLYYNAKLCFKDLTEKEIDARVIRVLRSLGLDHIRDLKVGSVLDKKISGGQRKRLNIALELIREPAVMFVDEPTSGLSSRDSENVIDLLKELSIKGKLIFVVIHQPSLDIYKMFDKMVILDKGGYPIYYGNPIEAISYFKRTANQVQGDLSQINPEQIFNVMEDLVVDEYGKYTNKRKISPKQWNEHYKANFTVEEVTPIDEKPPSSLKVPSIFTQAFIFTIRDLLSKVGNRQYMLINLLEAPILALLLAFVIRFQNSPDEESNYIFMYNDNVPAYILLCIIIALFMGLTVSAEEIIGDRKIQKREKFLNLSRFSYLISKVIILFILSAIQTFTFVLIGNAILEIQGELFSYWLILFSVSCFANVLGLNISSTFNSVVTIYITIPLLLIPQMILSGIIFKYDKMNRVISDPGKVPIVADFMVSRWAFEAIAVNHFMHNYFQEDYYKLDKKLSRLKYQDVIWATELEERLFLVENNYKDKEVSDSLKNEMEKGLLLMRNEIEKVKDFSKYVKEEKINFEKDFKLEGFSDETAQKLHRYIDKVREKINQETKDTKKDRDEIREKLEENIKNYNKIEETYYNEELNRLVTKSELQQEGTEALFEIEDNELIQMVDPIYYVSKPEAWYDYRTQFLAPRKYFAGLWADTYHFNIGVIWFFTFVMYITLYFDFFRNSINLISKIKFSKKE